MPANTNDITSELATILRGDLTAAADTLTGIFSVADCATIRAIGRSIPHLGSDSLLVLNIALADATEDAGNRAAAAKSGTRRCHNHLARFNALCAVHDLAMEAEAA